MKEKSHKEGPLKLINYYISESPEWLNDGPYTAGPAPFLRVNSLGRQEESFLCYMKFMKTKMDYTIIILNLKILHRNSTICFQHIILNSRSLIR